MRELDPSAEMKMDRLRDELRTRTESELKTRLKSVNNKINDSMLAAVTGTERIEEVLWLPCLDLQVFTPANPDFLRSRIVVGVATLVAHEQARRVPRGCGGSDIERYSTTRRYARTHRGLEDDLASSPHGCRYTDPVLRQRSARGLLQSKVLSHLSGTVLKIAHLLSEIPQGGVRHRFGEFRRTERMGF